MLLMTLLATQTEWLSEAIDSLMQYGGSFYG